MVDLPASWYEKAQNIDIAGIAAKVADYAPVIDVVRDTWDKETLTELLDGKIFVSDAVLNFYLKERLVNEENSPLKSIVVASRDGMMNINAVTKDDKKLAFEGTIAEFIKNKDSSRFVYRVKKHKFPGHGITSWVFGSVSLSMAQRLFGALPVSDKLPVTVKHNDVTVDFGNVIADSKLGQTEFAGQKLSDMVEIENALLKNGGMEIDTKLNISDGVKDALRRIVKQ